VRFRDPPNLSTSGSTGAPRLVPRSHRKAIAAAENVAGTLGFGPGRRVPGVVPFHYGNGFNKGLLVPLLSGATLVMMRQFNPGTCAELVHREKVDTPFGSPFIFGCLVDCDPTLLSTLKCCLTAGGRGQPRSSMHAAQRFRVRVHIEEVSPQPFEARVPPKPVHAPIHIQHEQRRRTFLTGAL